MCPLCPNLEPTEKHICLTNPGLLKKAPSPRFHLSQMRQEKIRHQLLEMRDLL